MSTVDRERGGAVWCLRQKRQQIQQAWKSRGEGAQENFSKGLSEEQSAKSAREGLAVTSRPIGKLAEESLEEEVSEPRK